MAPFPIEQLVDLDLSRVAPGADGDWLFCFSDSWTLRVRSLWRIASQGQLCFTSDQPRRGDAVGLCDLVADFVGPRIVERAVAEQGLGDLEIVFAGEHVLQIFNADGALPSWELRGPRDYLLFSRGQLGLEICRPPAA